jgi:hypothetical protein
VQKTNGDAEGERQWEDVDDDDEDDEGEDEKSKAAVDRVLKKYEKARVVDDDEGGGFDAQYDRSDKRVESRCICCVSFCPGGRCVLIDVGRVGHTRDILRRPAGYGQSYVPLCGEIAIGDALLL